jgi:carbon-monoxide dehydrogenase small subunit
VQLRLKVNGEVRELDLPDNALLLDVLRGPLGLTGTKRSCDVQVCGSCTVLVDGNPVSSCCFLAQDALDREVLTIEGFAGEQLFTELAEAFARNNAFQCGFCAPGFMMTCKPLLEEGRLTSQEDVRRELSGNICRCTGYRAILESVDEVAGVAEAQPS